MPPKIKTILASSSPRRLSLLNLIGINPEVKKPDITENIIKGEAPKRFTKRVAIEKGKFVQNNKNYIDLIISADTIVYCNNRIIGKPKNRDDAFRMIKLLSGRIHKVVTGVSLIYMDKNICKISETDVKFSNITKSEIDYYLDNEKFIDKAGAYAIQGKASLFVEEIKGCYFNVMGFPINLFYSMLKKINISFTKLSE